LPEQFQKTDLPAILWKLAGVLTGERQFDGALAALNEASKFMSKNRLQDPQLEAEILNDLGVVALYRGKTRKAETYFKRASSIQFIPQLVAHDAVKLDPGDILNNLGNVYQRTHQYAEAEDAFKRSLESLQGRIGDSHPNLITTLTSLGNLYTVTGRYKEAEDQYQRSLAILERRALTELDKRLLILTLHGLAKAYIGEHQEMRAEPLLAQAVDIVHRISMPAMDMPIVVDLLETYSKLLRRSLNPLEAERLQAEAQRIRASMAFTVRANGTSR
jgi:tetratricopeptide (TPR) repeat protein